MHQTPQDPVLHRPESLPKIEGQFFAITVEKMVQILAEPLLRLVLVVKFGAFLQRYKIKTPASAISMNNHIKRQRSYSRAEKNNICSALPESVFSIDKSFCEREIISSTTLKSGQGIPGAIAMTFST